MKCETRKVDWVLIKYNDKRKSKYMKTWTVHAVHGKFGRARLTTIIPTGSKCDTTTIWYNVSDVLLIVIVQRHGVMSVVLYLLHLSSAFPSPLETFHDMALMAPR